MLAALKSRDGYSSFEWHELLERLPANIPGKGPQKHWWLKMNKGIGPMYSASYARHFINEIPYVETRSFDNFGTYEPTIAEALGKLYLWCLGNGHCNE